MTTLHPDTVKLLRPAAERGLHPRDIALASIDLRSAAWMRLRARLPERGLRLAAPPMPVAILLLDRAEARTIVRAAGPDAKYADPSQTLDSASVPLVMIDDGPS